MIGRFVVGLTGGIGSGKSTVARLLAARGAAVMDADAAVHRLYEAGGEGARALAAALGPEVLDGRGAVDRPRLAARVFADAPLRGKVEAAIHPLVMAAVEAWLHQVPEGVVPVVEAALLVETGLHRQFARLVVVACSPETQVARAKAREAALPEEAIRARLAAHLPLSAKRREAHYVIENDGTLADLEPRVASVMEALRRDMQAARP